MKLADLLDPRCPECRHHEIWDHGLCWYCCQEKGLLPPPSDEYKAMQARLGAAANRGRFVQENDYDPEDDTLYWEPRDE